MKVNKVLMLVFVFVGLMSIVSFASNENNAFMKKAAQQKEDFYGPHDHQGHLWKYKYHRVC